MLTNTVIKVTFGDLRAEQISAIIFHCGVLYHTEFDFLWLLIPLRSRKNGFKYLALLITIFILWRKHNLDLLCWARYFLSVTFISFAKKVAIDFCQFFLSDWGYCSHWVYKIKSGGHRARLREKEHLSGLVWGKSLTFCTRALICALMTQNSCAVGMRNAKLGNHLKYCARPAQAGRTWWYFSRQEQVAYQ